MFDCIEQTTASKLTTDTAAAQVLLLRAFLFVSLFRIADVTKIAVVLLYLQATRNKL
jgi:hypothetical protein